MYKSVERYIYIVCSTLFVFEFLISRTHMILIWTISTDKFSRSKVPRYVRWRTRTEGGQRVLAGKWVDPDNCLIVWASPAFTYERSQLCEGETQIDIQNCLISITKWEYFIS